MLSAVGYVQLATRALSVSPSLLVLASVPLSKGHSKWQNIKATKGKNDMIKSQATNLLLRKTKSAALRGGFDLKLNRELAALEQDFRSQGLSLDTFKNFLQRLKDKPELEYTFDVIGPGGTFFIIQAETDNKKHVESTLRKYFNKARTFRLAADGSGVRSWFDEKGVLTVDTKKDGKDVKLDQMEEIGIELDCEEVALIDDDGKKFELLCDPQKVNSIEDGLSKAGFSLRESVSHETMSDHNKSFSSDDSWQKLALPYDAFDVLISDIDEHELVEIGAQKEIEHLSSATFSSPAFPVKGWIYGRNLRCMIPLVCQRGGKPGSKAIIIWFLCDTGSPFTCVSEKSLEGLYGEGNITHLRYDLVIQDQTLEIACQVSKEHFRDVNILGMDAMQKMQLSIEIDWTNQEFTLIKK